MFPVGLFLQIKIDGCQNLIKRLYQESPNNVLGELNPHPIFGKNELYKVYIVWEYIQGQVEGQFIDIDVHVDVTEGEVVRALHPFNQNEVQLEYLKISDLNQRGQQLTILKEDSKGINLAIYLYAWSETFKNIKATAFIYNKQKRSLEKVKLI